MNVMEKEERINMLKEKEEFYRSIQEKVKSDKMEDMLSLLADRWMLNAIGKMQKEVFESVLTLITGNFEGKYLEAKKSQNATKWRYEEKSRNLYAILVVDPKNRVIQLNRSELIHLGEGTINLKGLVDVEIEEMESWKKQLELAREKLGILQVKERAVIDEALRSLQWDREQAEKRKNRLKDKLHTHRDLYFYFEELEQEIQTIVSMYEAAGFRFECSRPEKEHYAIKAKSVKTKPILSPEQELLNSLMPQNNKGNYPYEEDLSFWFGWDGELFSVGSVALFQDIPESRGYALPERVLTIPEMNKLFQMMKESPRVKHCWHGEYAIEFTHADVPMRYEVYPNGKITIVHTDPEDNRLYTNVGLRTLLDIEGFTEWFRSLGSHHYSKI